MKIKQYIFTCISLILFSCGTENNEPNNNPTENNFGLQKLDQIDFSNTAINTVAVDDSSNLWIGTATGLYLLKNEKWYQHPHFNSLTVNTLSVHNNNILIATNSGAYSLALVNNEFSLTDSITKDLFGGTSDETTAFAYDLYDKMWLGTNDELAFFDGEKWNRNEKIKNNLGGISAISSMAFRTEDCFFGTYGKYMYHISYKSQSSVDAISGASQMLGGAEDPESSFNGELTTDTVFCVFAGNDGAIWYGSTAGLTRNIGSTSSYTGDFKYYLRGQRVHSILEASDGRIWAGTENGLSCLEGSSWKNYTTSEGLPGDTILSMCEDNDGTIWVGTNKGLSHLSDGIFTNY